MATARRKKDVDAALKAVSESDVKKVLEQIGTTQTSVQGTLAALGVTMTGKITELRDLETAIGARKDELKDIHEIEVQADTLVTITEKVDEAEKDAKERTKARKQEWADDASEREAAWTREAEEHAYSIKQIDARDAATLAEQSTERQRAERFRMEDVNKRLSERVAEVDDRESLVEEMETQIEAIPAQLEAAATEAKAAVTDSLTRAFSHERAMLKKDAESAAALSAAEGGALVTQIANLAKQLETCQEQLGVAREDSKTIAAAAVEASSQRQVAASLKDAMETQASSPTGRGGR